MFSLRLCLIFVVLTGTAVVSRAGENPRPWSFEPLIQTETLPAVKDTSWPRSRIDHFILASMEENGFSPSAPAAPRMMLRRLHFTLTGLPPAPEDLAAFDPARVDKTIDTLLATPQYGERQARHWLDLARYTDVTASWLKSTAGSWRYRDWVVAAFNDDIPYPDFVKRQLATDLMSSTGPEDHVALGFLGLSPMYWKELQLPPEIIKTTVADEWEERIDTVGRTFLGLTLACARCHDHKTDPVSTADYYALAGVFASVKITDRPTMSEDLWKPVKKARELVAGLETQKKNLSKKKPRPADYDGQIKELDKKIATIKNATPHYNMAMANGVIEAALYVEKKDKGHGTNLNYQTGMSRDLPIQKRGNPNQTGDIVPRRFLSEFPGSNGSPRSFTKGSGRLELAEALIEDSEALFARVMVNRIWKIHFGTGLVRTPGDFGNTGEAPTHRQLLDDLAARFIANGWSIKWLHREILQSATWQQTSINPQSEQKDPENLYYSRMPRRRLDIEAWRDAMLYVSGELDLRTGGAGQDLDDSKNVRRTLYGKIHRRDLNKMLQVHDFPDPAAHHPSREETISPLQMLFALNSPLVHARASALATRFPSADRITTIYQTLFQRNPTATERELGETYSTETDPANYAALLLVSNEFLYID
ncbi:MAG: DUF1549 and DUF1553 domain-containing protein [Verrucomicrobiales bacterium]|nr:DUF1549 and DUF1553 domain-containing protein [Verrucomicrobiales bacterium]